MTPIRMFIFGGALVASAGALGSRPALQAATRQQTVQAPRFEVDPMWPRPMPNRWILGSATGVAVDSRDHVFVLNLTDSFNARTEMGAATDPPTGECCVPAPSVLEFDPDGNLVAHWGGPGAGLRLARDAFGVGARPGRQCLDHGRGRAGHPNSQVLARWEVPDAGRRSGGTSAAPGRSRAGGYGVSGRRRTCGRTRRTRRAWWSRGTRSGSDSAAGQQEYGEIRWGCGDQFRRACR